MNPTLPPPRLPPPVGVEHALSLVLVNVKANAAHSSPASDPSPTASQSCCVYSRWSCSCSRSCQSLRVCSAG